MIARVRSLVRLKMMTDELRMRAVTSKEIGLENPAREAVADTGRGARLLIVDDRQTSWERMAQTLALEHTVDVETEPRRAVFLAAETPFDLAIVSLGLENYDGLRLCSHIRSLDRTRNLPLLAIAEADDNTRLMRGLEIGVNDYLIRPIDPNELLARVRAQVKKKRYAERLRDNVQMSIEAAITDALTGLHNRRYMESHLGTLVEQAAGRGRPLSILILDIDFFKSINDTHGHSAGDEVLKEFSRRLKKAVRGIDLACRYGGEEFVVVMPDTDIAMATWRSGCAGASLPSRFRSTRTRGRCRRRFRSASRRCDRPRTCRPPSSSAPTRRSTAPRAKAATESPPTPRDAGAAKSFPGAQNSSDQPLNFTLNPNHVVNQCVSC
jgi:two-component system, cell cycle response regulator